MQIYWRVKEVHVVDHYAIQVRFVDGLMGVVRFQPGFFRGVFFHLIDPQQFKQVTVVNGAVTWPGNLDLAPDAMYQEIKAQGEWSIAA